MQTFIASFGVLAPLIFILIVILAPFFFFPMSFLAIVGGVLFGFLKGSLYLMIGIVVNCYAMYIVSRYICDEYVNKLLKRRLKKEQVKAIENLDKNKLSLSLFIARLIPVIPYSLINYLFALSPMGLVRYMLAGILGTMPSKLVYLNVGSSTSLTGTSFFWSILLLIILLIVTKWLSRYQK